VPNSGFGDMLELVIGTSHQRFRWQVVPAGSLARPVGARYEDAPKLSRCQRTLWLMPRDREQEQIRAIVEQVEDDQAPRDASGQCHGNSDSSAVRRRLASSDETDIV
jgi:hypothetical protein